ncbi:helix-turn-helix transcriptional regulator [Rhodoferax sp. GW822-FHT02A01]|uniref:helix-turn-helix domain-containing protein n=1 Tax=Rhodoferax sp. GW822-FHT02A01 TaxID=3141537 RepID=UPI00315CE632
MTTPLPSFGKRLKRLRRVKGLKQETIAALANVNQATVSRWESGAIAPPQETMQRLLRALDQIPFMDSALQRLVHTSSLPVHLITDVDHRLLAASIPRQRMWGIAENAMLQTSLWKFATTDIVAAESRLGAVGWWEQEAPEPVLVHLRSPQTEGLHIHAGTMLWERVWLANGLPARLCTSLECHA